MSSINLFFVEFIPQKVFVLFIFLLVLNSNSFGQTTDGHEHSYYESLSDQEKKHFTKPDSLFYDSYMTVNTEKYETYLAPEWVNNMLTLAQSDIITFKKVTQEYSQKWYDDYGDPYIRTFNSFEKEVNLLDTIHVKDTISISLNLPNAKSQLIKRCEVVVLEDEKYNELDFVNTSWSAVSAELSNMYLTFTGKEFTIILTRIDLEADEISFSFLDIVGFVFKHPVNLISYEKLAKVTSSIANIWDTVNNKADWFMEGIEADRNLSNIPKEFLNFYESFISDSIFQSAHIAYSELIGVLGECDTTVIYNKENWTFYSWNFTEFFSKNNNTDDIDGWDNTFYSSENRFYYQFRLKEAGWIYKTGFERIDGTWKLTLHYISAC